MLVMVQEEPQAPRPGRRKRGGNPPVDVSMIARLLARDDLLLRTPGGEIFTRERIIAAPGEWERLATVHDDGWILSDHGVWVIAERYTF